MYLDILVGIQKRVQPNVAGESMVMGGIFHPYEQAVATRCLNSLRNAV